MYHNFVIVCQRGRLNWKFFISGKFPYFLFCTFVTGIRIQAIIRTIWEERSCWSSLIFPCFKLNSNEHTDLIIIINLCSLFDRNFSIRGDSNIQMPCQNLFLLPSPRQYRILFLRRYLWSSTYFHIVKALAVFLTSKKLFLDKYFTNTTLIHKLLGSLRIFLLNFVKNTTLTSWISLMSRLPSYFGPQISSQTINGILWFGPFSIPEKFSIILSKSFAILRTPIIQIFYYIIWTYLYENIEKN